MIDLQFIPQMEEPYAAVGYHPPATHEPFGQIVSGIALLRYTGHRFRHGGSC